jgi:tetratricopeptide (TPR) repeat protein
VELRVKSVGDLQNVAQPFEGKNAFQKAMRFGDDKMKNMLSSYNEGIKARNELARVEAVYAKAQEKMKKGGTESNYKDAAKLFESISHHKDSAELAKQCYEYAEYARKDSLIKYAKSYIDRGAYETALNCLEKIPGWRDVDELKEVCLKGIQEKKEREQKRRDEFDRRVDQVTQKAPKIANILLATGIGGAILGTATAVFAIVSYVINYL